MTAFVFPLCLLLTAGWLGASESLPEFEDYPVTERLEGDPAAVDLSSDPNARTFRTRLRRAAAAGPDFAGIYAMAYWGCGMGCTMFAVIDLRSGKVMFPEDNVFHFTGFPKEFIDTGGDKIEYRLDSSLLIINGQQDPAEGPGSYYYQMKDGELTLIESVLWPRTQDN